MTNEWANLDAWSARTLVTTLVVVVTCLGGPAPAQDARAIEADGPAYPVGRFSLRFAQSGHPQLPTRKELMDLEVTLGQLPGGFVAPRDGVPSITLELDDFEDRPVEQFHASALRTVFAALHEQLARRNLVGVFVAPHPRDIDETGKDRRDPDEPRLRIMITTAVVTEIRTLASGDRVDPEARLNHPLHAAIIERSPLQPFVAPPDDADENDDAPIPDGADKEKRRNLIRKDKLDEYLFRLSRHPGRRVDAALSPGTEPGGVTLDYLIRESNPLLVYAQISNTGTKSTDRVRERFGFMHTQLTNNDDILSLDYSTAAFDEVNSFVGSYEAPLGYSERFRIRLYGNWSEFTASELGFQNDAFTGESSTIGGELITRVHQDGNLFVDLLAGFQHEDIQVDNQIAGISGRERFEFAHFGFRLEKQSAWSSIAGSVVAEWNDGQSPRPNLADLGRLGRVFPDADFGRLRWDLNAAAYLEPLLDRAAWEDPTTPESSRLVHEVALSFRGQYAFDNRLVPQFQHVAGGFSSVRGYPESVVAGDTVLIGRAEYRYHYPRALGIEPTPADLFGEPFRIAPQSVYGRPDWDLIFRAFVDVGQTLNNDKLFFESDETLVGAGVGVEVQLRSNLNLRADWGFALRGIEPGDVHAGSNRLHVIAGFSF